MLKDLTADSVDEDGKTVGTAKLKAGDKVVYYRTDGKAWADLMLSDGTIVRVNPEYTGDYWAVNGVNIEEMFDGITFGR